MYVMRVIPDLERLRVHNVSLDDLIEATKESGMVGTPEQEQLRRAKQTLEPVRGESAVGVVGRFNEPKFYENIILKASPEGEILRLKDVARVESDSSFIMPGGGAQTYEDFNDIGHTLFTLLVAWLGGLISCRLRSVS
jgi:HAE1 family hydrophobic/amphiphilic exporter-1